MPNTSNAPFDFLEAARHLNDDGYLDVGLVDMLGTSRECEICNGDFGPALEYTFPESHCGGSIFLCRMCALEAPLHNEGLELIPISEVKVDYSDLEHDVFFDNLRALHKPWGWLEWNVGFAYDPLQARYKFFIQISNRG